MVKEENYVFAFPVGEFNDGNENGLMQLMLIDIIFVILCSAYLREDLFAVEECSMFTRQDWHMEEDWVNGHAFTRV